MVVVDDCEGLDVPVQEVVGGFQQICFYQTSLWQRYRALDVVQATTDGEMGEDARGASV